MKANSLILLLLISFTSCQWLDEEEMQPSYVEINEIKLKNPAGSGYLSHGISDVWVFLDGKNLGIYPVPTHIACLPESEDAELYIYPGIRINGMPSSLEQYGMLENLVLKPSFIPGESITINPVFEYRNDVKIRIDERFEDADHLFSFDADDDPSTNMQISSQEAESGNYAGVMNLSQENFIVEIATQDAYIGIPTDGNAIFLELDYKSNANLFIGLIGYNDLFGAGQPLKANYLGLLPSDEWQKIYVNLTPQFVNSDLKSYRVMFRGELTGNSSGDQQIYLDNIKLLHF